MSCTRAPSRNRVRPSAKSGTPAATASANDCFAALAPAAADALALQDEAVGELRRRPDDGLRDLRELVQPPEPEQDIAAEAADERIVLDDRLELADELVGAVEPPGEEHALEVLDAAQGLGRRRSLSVAEQRQVLEEPDPLRELHDEGREAMRARRDTRAGRSRRPSPLRSMETQ